MDWKKETKIKKIQWEELVVKKIKLRVIVDLNKDLFCTLFEKDKVIFRKKFKEKNLNYGKAVLKNQLKDIYNIEI